MTIHKIARNYIALFKTLLYSIIFILFSSVVLAQGPALPGKLAIYYGFPSSVNQTFNVDSAAAVFADYDLVLLAGVLQFPQFTDSIGTDPLFGCTQNRHHDHDNTVAIINQLNTIYNVPVYGYVSLGGENTFTPCGALPFEGTVINPADPLQIKGGMKERIDRWADMGVTGIFLDEAGYDFGTDRPRQNLVIDYVHSKGLSVFINAYIPDDVFSSDAVGTVTYPDGSSLGGQQSSVAMNPDGLSTHLGSNDIFLLESFAIIQGDYQPTSFWQDRADKMLYYRQQYGTKVATVTTTLDTTCSPGNFLPSDQAQFEYAWWATFLYDFDYMGWGEGTNFSASGPCNAKLPFRPRPNPTGVGQTVQPVAVGHDLNRHIRATTTGIIELNSDTRTGQFIPGPPPVPDPCGTSPGGISSWWPAEGNADDIFSGHNGTLNPLKSWFTTGKVGEAFSFDGVNDVIPLGAGPSITGTGEFTIEGWIKTSADGVIIQQRDANSVSGQYIFSVGELPAGFPNNNPGRSGKLSFGTFDGASFGLDFSSNTSVNDGQFHHVAVVRESDGTGKIYIDGALDATQLPANPSRNLQPIGVFIGADTRNNAQFFFGLIDELTIYNRALAQAEIQSVFDAGSGGKCPDPLVSFWTLDEGVGSTANDSTQRNPGTLVNGPVWTTGTLGNALNFDGVDDYVNMGNQETLNFGTDDFTIEAWIRTEPGQAPATAGTIAGKYNNYPLYYIRLVNNGQLESRIGFSPSENFQSVNDASPLNDGNWHHVVAVFDRDGFMTRYVDGDVYGTPLDISSASAQSIDNTNPFRIGASGSTATLTQLFEGSIDEVGVYRGALTPAEIQQQFERGLSDRTILIALYTATDGANWTNNNNWLSADMSTWHGVTVVNGRVTRLQLEFNNLNGTLPPELGNLSELQLLRMNNNQLTGNIPAELGGLTALTELNLGHNQLSGSIPTSLGSMFSLTNLTVWHNQLDGSIPASLGNLTNLTVLRLANNQLTGSIPATLGNLGNLRTFQAEFNQLDGNIPPELGDLSALQSLRLNNNLLDGSIPPELGDLGALLELILGHNQLGGNIPATLGNLSGLTNLTVWHNQLNGSIPASLGDLANLSVLRLAYNQLSGAIPASLGNLGSLRFFQAEFNQVSGNIPSELGDLAALESLRMNNNLLDGSIPPELGDLIALTEMNLGHNQLTGGIPPELGDLTSLTNLTIWHNLLDSSIPSSLGSLTNLTVLRLAYNQLSGAIPASLGNLANLRFFQAEFNQLSSNIPPDLGDLAALESLRINSNQLDGSIPTELGDLAALTELILGHNQLTGSIPASLGNLSNLTNLTLWHNQLNGDVPTTFTGLTNLTVLRLSNNQLLNLPDLSSLTTLIDFQVDNNRFTFEDLEPNAGISGFNYAPQAKVGTIQSFALSLGGSINLSIPVGGSSNNYQWFKNATLIPGANSDSYGITSIAAGDFGDYTLQITNPFLPQLTLVSNKKRVLQGTIEMQNIAAGDPPPATFATSGVTLDFSSLDANADVDVIQYQAEPLNVPVFFQPELGSYWNIEQQGATTFTTEVCFSLAGLDPSVDPQDLQLLKREDESEPWNIITTVLRPDANNPTEICAENVSGFSDFVFAVRTPPTIAGQFVGEDCQAAISAADVIGISDPEGELTVTVSPANLVLGDNAVTITVDDGVAVYSEVVTVNVADTTAPTISLNGDNPLTLVRYGSPYAEPGAAITDNCDANPTLTISSQVNTNITGVYNVTYEATDESGNQRQVTRTVNVVDDPNTLSHLFLYLAGSSINIDKTNQIEGSIHSNGTIDIKKGPSSFTGNLSAVGDIDIAKNVTIDGDVTTGGQLVMANNVSISGDAADNAAVSAVALPSFSFGAGSADVTIDQNETLTLPPGSYGKLLAEKKATLQLSAGEYFFEEFEFKKDAVLEIDVSENPVTINVVENIIYQKDVTMALLPLGDVDSRYITFNSHGDIQIHDGAVIRGIFNAPDGKVDLSKDVNFLGIVCAKEIDVAKNVKSTHPDKLLPLAKTGTDGEGDKPKTDEIKELPRQFTLSQNFPNPFNPSTTIPYAIPKVSYVRIEIYNLLGQRVKILINETKQPGSYTVIWNGRNALGEPAPSGVYLYRLQAGDFQQSRKLLLLK